MVTNIINNKKFTLKIPATRVSGSPITGSHENNREQAPNFLNLLEALLILFFLKGSHFLLVYLNK